MSGKFRGQLSEVSPSVSQLNLVMVYRRSDFGVKQLYLLSHFPVLEVFHNMLPKVGGVTTVSLNFKF